MLRQIFLKSTERAEAMKRDKYTCQKCFRKKTTRKIIDDKTQVRKLQVHHKNGIDVWDKVIDLIYDEILCDPKDLETLCPECHKGETYKDVEDKDNLQDLKSENNDVERFR